MIKVKKIKPLFTRILTTARVYSMDELSGLVIDPRQVQGSLKEFQEVLEVGEMVRNIKVGDLVKVDPKNYAVKKYKEGSLKDGVVTSNPVVEYKFNTIEVDGKPCLLLQESDIEYIVSEWEEEQKDSGIIHPNNSIVVD